ncbi:beta-1,6-glucan boisynthesis protein-like protein [Paraphoma chrysanthemicola]|nr:beta-1,6-glucan boisynthesis protein-like protein [Paraphoma chrysanthemicola]
MARLLLPLAALTALVPFVSAGVSFTSPKAGATLTAGTAIEVKWEDDGDSPKLTDLLTYELFLVAGGNKAEQQFVVLPITTQGSFAVGSTASGMVGITVGESTPKNAYFLKMVAVGKTGGQYITYSKRFSYSGMTGVWPATPAVKTGLDSIDGTDGPATEDNTNKGGAGAAPAAGDYGIAYTMQTGPTRYAPMQPVPPTKITAKNTKPLYPTSSVSIATTRLPIPKIVTTLTQSQTYSVSSRENTVAPAAHATDDMQRFLNRWKD